MAQHVFTGNGAPGAFLNAAIGSHYIDLGTGKQYLLGTSWVEGGGGGGSSLAQNFVDAALVTDPFGYKRFTPDPDIATAFDVDGGGTTNPLIVDLSAIDVSASSGVTLPWLTMECIVRGAPSLSFSGNTVSGVQVFGSGLTLVEDVGSGWMVYALPTSGGIPTPVLIRITRMRNAQSPWPRAIVIESCPLIGTVSVAA